MSQEGYLVDVAVGSYRADIARRDFDESADVTEKAAEYTAVHMTTRPGVTAGVSGEAAS